MILNLGFEVSAVSYSQWFWNNDFLSSFKTLKYRKLKFLPVVHSILIVLFLFSFGQLIK